MANWDGEGRVVVVVLDVSFGRVDEGGFVVFNFVLHASDAILKAILLFGICLIMPLECSSQPFSDVGDQNKANVMWPFDDLECSMWGERGRLEATVYVTVL